MNSTTTGSLPENVSEAYQDFLEKTVEPRLLEFFDDKDVSEPFIKATAHTVLMYAVAHVMHTEDQEEVSTQMEKALFETAQSSSKEVSGYVYKQSKAIGWLESSGVAEELMMDFKKNVVPVIKKEYATILDKIDPDLER